MAGRVPLVDTSIIIEALRGNKIARDFLVKNEGFSYSLVTKKELYQKKGLSGGEKREIEKILSLGQIALLDTSILDCISMISPLYYKKHITDSHDIIICATALVKKMPLATLNKKHFSFIPGLTLLTL